MRTLPNPAEIRAIVARFGITAQAPGPLPSRGPSKHQYMRRSNVEHLHRIRRQFAKPFTVYDLVAALGGNKRKEQSRLGRLVESGHLRVVQPGRSGRYTRHHALYEVVP